MSVRYNWVMQKMNITHKDKKPWKKPTFFVLIRADRQEYVLVVCKQTGAGALGLDAALDRCLARGGCSDCSTISIS